MNEHQPVLYTEALQAMSVKKDGIYVDCTFGRGGHSRGILSQLSEAGRLLALDRDPDAISSDFAGSLHNDHRFELIHGCFSELENRVVGKGWQGRVDGVLMDFGVSSPQLDDPQRGFSFLRDGPLDMRMDKSSGLSAAQWLAQVEEQELVRVLFEYGEERFARRIARAIMQQRCQTAIETTRQLAGLVEAAVPVREKNKHPATRSFQAIRIKMNRELDEIESVLDQAVRVLKPGGRMVVISFHSLEDRIVKRFIRDESRGRYHQDKLPIQNEAGEEKRLAKKGKAIRAGAMEVKQNPRSRSAVMRVAERV